MQQGEVMDTTLPLSLFSVAASHFHIKQVDGKSLYISCLLLKAIPLNPLAVCHRWHVCTGHRSATAVHRAYSEQAVEKGWNMLQSEILLSLDYSSGPILCFMLNILYPV